MKPSVATAPTLLNQPTAACPRCNGRRLLQLVAHPDSEFEWRECEDCRYLWAIPHGWTPHAEPRVPRFGA
jgi:hypothetical protein